MNRPARVLLSFHCAYKRLAMQLSDDLRRAQIDVVYDQWEGGGSTPASRAIGTELAGMGAVVVLLTPSENAPTWIDDQWKRTVFDRAALLAVPVLPVRGEPCTIPSLLASRNFADICSRGYEAEMRRLVQRIGELTGDERIAVPDDAVAPRSAATTSPVAPLALEIGPGLAAPFDAGILQRLAGELVPMMRDGLFYELGVPCPRLTIREAPGVPFCTARVLINDVPETQFELHPGWIVVNDSADAMAEHGFDAIAAVNPANGHPCAWIPGRHRAEAESRGLTVWDEAGFVILTVSALLRKKAADFIDLDESRRMVGKLAMAFPHLVDETIGKSVSLFTLSDVLRRLVAEEVPIRNLRRIVLALAEWGRVEHDPLYLTEYVRASLRREIMHKFSTGTNELVVFLLDPTLEAMIAGATVHTATGSYVDLPADSLRSLVGAIRAAFTSLGEGVQRPVILTVMEIRAAVQRLVAPSMPLLKVTSYQEVKPDMRIQPVGRIALEGNQLRAFTVDAASGIKR